MLAEAVSTRENSAFLQTSSALYLLKVQRIYHSKELAPSFRSKTPSPKRRQSANENAHTKKERRKRIYVHRKELIEISTTRMSYRTYQKQRKILYGYYNPKIEGNNFIWTRINWYHQRAFSTLSHYLVCVFSDIIGYKYHISGLELQLYAHI